MCKYTGKKARASREVDAHEEEDGEEATAAAEIHEELVDVRDGLLKVQVGIAEAENKLKVRLLGVDVYI
jgi:hypothetical protein